MVQFPGTLSIYAYRMAELEDPSLRQESEVNQLLFWKEHQAMFPLLKPLAEDRKRLAYKLLPACSHIYSRSVNA